VTEPQSPFLSATYINELVRHGDAIFREEFRSYMVQFMQEGHPPFTEPLSPADEEAYLKSAEAVQTAQQLMGSQEESDRARGLELALQIQAVRRNGNSQTA
jgi:hypothetical protein